MLYYIHTVLSVLSHNEHPLVNCGIITSRQVSFIRTSLATDTDSIP